MGFADDSSLQVTRPPFVMAKLTNNLPAVYNSSRKGVANDFVN